MAPKNPALTPAVVLMGQCDWLIQSHHRRARKPKKIENFSTKLKLTEVGNGFFLLNVQGKIEMLNMLFFYYGKQHGSFKFKARARAFWKMYKNLLHN